MSAGPARWCAGCGRSASECGGCRGELDPPRYCPSCGRRLAVRVTPTRWTARCSEHGVLGSDSERIWR